MTRPIRLLHIGYSAATAAAIEPGFELLDNTANPRPDWYEIWPIRQWLHAHLNKPQLDETTLYGFFSPKLRAKTGLGAEQLIAFANAHPQAELCLFSPQPDVAMVFRSVFHGGERFSPGYLAVAQAVLNQAGAGVDLTKVVMDSRVSVFSNYLLGTARFWRQWLGWADVLFDVAESGPEALRAALNAPTSYGSALRKVFVAEGFASLLAWGGSYRVAAISPFEVPWFSQFSGFKSACTQLDALKMAYRDTGRAAYVTEFDRLSEQVIAQALSKAGSTVSADGATAAPIQHAANQALPAAPSA